MKAKKTYTTGMEYSYVTIKVVSAPTITVDLPAKTCNDLDLTTLFKTNVSGGTWNYTAFDPATNQVTTGISGSSLIVSQTSLSNIRITGTYTVAGCTVAANSDEINVVPGGSSALSILNTASYCQGTGTVALTYSLSGATSASSAWSGVGVTGSNLDFSASSAGSEVDVLLSVTTTTGCLLNATKKILVKPTPTISFSAQQIKYCNSGQGISLQNDYQPKDGNETISGTWSSSNSTVNNKISGSNLSLSGVAQGSYPFTFAYTNSSGCSASQTVANSIQVYEQPSGSLVLNASPSNEVCASTNFSLSTSSVSSNLGINWFSPAGYVGSTTSINTGTLSTGEYPYLLIVNNNSNGNCFSMASVRLEVESPATLSFTPGSLSICQGEYSIDLTSKFVSNYDSLVFSSSNPVISNQLSGAGNKMLNLTGVPSGNYVITGTVRYKSCFLSTNFTLVVTTEYANPVVSGSIILCEPQSTTLTVTSASPSLQYRWFNSTAVGATPFYTGTWYQTPVLDQTKTYYLQAYNASSKCASERGPINIIVQRMDTVAMNIGEDLASCTNAVSFNLNRPGLTPSGGIWSGPGVSGTTFNGSALQNNKAYNVIYSYTKELCTKRDTLLVTLGIDIKPKVDKSTSYTGELVQFSHNYPNATSTLWTFGDGMKSTDWQAKHYYYRAGSKNVTLAITVNQNGVCSGSITIPAMINVLDTFDIVTGTEDDPAAIEVTAFPVPFAQTLSLSSKTDIGSIEIELLRVDGVILVRKERSISAGTNLIIDETEASSITPGLYILRLRNNKSVQTFKIFKQ